MSPFLSIEADWKHFCSKCKLHMIVLSSASNLSCFNFFFHFQLFKLSMLPLMMINFMLVLVDVLELFLEAITERINISTKNNSDFLLLFQTCLLYMLYVLLYLIKINDIRVFLHKSFLFSTLRRNYVCMSNVMEKLNTLLNAN